MNGMIELGEEELRYLRSNYGRIPVYEIAAHLYVSEATVYRLVRSYGIEPVPKPKGNRETANKHYWQWTPKDHKLFLTMIDEGYTYREIAVALHRTVGAVQAFKCKNYPDYSSPQRQSKVRGKGKAEHEQ